MGGVINLLSFSHVENQKDYFFIWGLKKKELLLYKREMEENGFEDMFLLTGHLKSSHRNFSFLSKVIKIIKVIITLIFIQRGDLAEVKRRRQQWSKKNRERSICCNYVGAILMLLSR